MGRRLTNQELPKSRTSNRIVVHQHLHGNRTTMTLRILPEVKEAFTKRTRELGLSTCHVAEGLFTGWLYGVVEKVELVHQSPTIDLTLVRDVKRVRRYYKEEIEEERTVQKCTFRDCKNAAIAKALYIPKNQQHLVCNKHLEGIKVNSKMWQVLESLPDSR
jgi:hypothetical protein